MFTDNTIADSNPAVATSPTPNLNHAILLPGESAERFDDLRANFFSFYQPINAIESEQVEDMVRSRWVMNRLTSLQSAILWLERAGLESTCPDVAGLPSRALAATAYVCASDRRAATALHRDIARNLRIYNSAVKEFNRLVKLRPPTAAPAPTALRAANPLAQDHEN